MTARDEALLAHGTHEAKNKEIVSWRETAGVMSGVISGQSRLIRILKEDIKELKEGDSLASLPYD